ncbi:MAG TPA: DNA methyltransferase [Gemmatimonadaceae bacterium]|nr:DNA methyltransferase [Gemmatimonadaceae bacterium]
MFVHDVLRSIELGDDAIILDPWNGSGTTTQVAHELGHATVGYDLNPVMVLVAKARLVNSLLEPGQLALCDSIVRAANTYRAPVSSSDPLRAWFVRESSTYIRHIERAIQAMLVGSTRLTVASPQSFDSVSSLAAFFFVALFRTARELARGFRTSNPTWIKHANDSRTLLRPSREKVQRVFRENVGAMMREAHGIANIVQAIGEARVPLATLQVADSRALPRAASSVDAIVTSPPYCTRIDYAIATRVELAVLGCSVTELRSLRERLLGTSTVGTEIPQVSDAWGPACRRFLGNVEAHTSKASRTYYLKNHLQYFDGLWRSLEEMRRVVKPGGVSAIVVQDSYYKDIRNDLPRIVRQMAHNSGWDHVTTFNYRVRWPLSAVHVHARTYRVRSSAIESVLWLSAT